MGIHPVWFNNKLTVSNDDYRLCAEDRKVIANTKQAGKAQSETSQAIGFCQSTISKKRSANLGKRGYRPDQANRLALDRKLRKRTRLRVMVGLIKDAAEARLRIKPSPE